MKKCIPLLLVIVLQFGSNANAQVTPSNKTDRKIQRLLKGNWELNQNLSDSILVLKQFDWTADNINNQFNYLNFAVLDNKMQAIVIRTNVMTETCGTGTEEMQEYKLNPALSTWKVENGKLHLLMQYNYQKLEYKIDRFYSVKKNEDTLILFKL